MAGNELAVGSHTINTGFSLVSGAVYTFSITTITDQAGNPTPDVTVSGITFDSTALPIALTSPTSGSTLTTGQVGITLGEDAQSATITFTRTGGAEDPGAPHSYPLSGNDLLAGSRTITTNLPLVEGTVYSISLATTDLVGNQATTVTVTGVTFAVIHPLVLAGLPASAPYGQSGIVATVSGGNGSGAVSYSHGDSTACTVNATSGAVTITSGTGNCTITATKTADASFADTSSAPVSITITKANAAITLDSTTLDQDYIGTARIVTATTSPAGLSYSVTYNGSPTPPIAVGSYSIVATINDPNYQGSSSGTLIISDQSKPAISSFTALPRANYLIADITINASDNLLVTGYCLTEGGDSSGCAWSSTSPASYTFATPGPKTLTAYVRDAAGNISTGHGSTFTVSIPTLTVTVTGTGTGTVTSVPAGITCTTSSCTKELSGTVDLYATPSALSLFGGWSGGVCSGTAGICNVTMNGNKSVTATFSPAPLLHIDGTPYASLQAAYDAATSGAVIQLLETTTAGTLTANRPVTVKLKGGYNAAYSATPGETIVTAPLKIRQGKVLADKLNVR